MRSTTFQGKIIVSMTFPLLQQLVEFFASNPEGKTLVTKLRANLPFVEKQGMFYFKERLFIPNASRIKQSLLFEFHATSLGGYSCVKATMARLLAVFFLAKNAR